MKVQLCIFFALSLSWQCCSASEMEERRKAKMEVRRAEHRKRVEEARREFGLRGSSPTATGQETRLETIPFDSVRAPRPELCFMKFVQTAQSASSIDQLLPFLPSSRQRFARTSSAWEFPRLRRIALKFLRVRNVTTNGNKAELHIATRSTTPGDKYPYGTATVTMLGEGSYWRLSKYNDDNIEYSEPQ